MLATESVPQRSLARSLRLGLAAGLLLAGAAHAHGQAARGAPSLKLQLPTDLHVGEHARFVIEVHMPPGAGQPLLLTPFREGQALEVVKGRLLRSDARDAQANPLLFELPVLARAPGSALIGVRLLAYQCEPGCRSVEVEARASVMVLP
jgi:hypothetical protein